jgi:hypothetical protein
VTLSSTAVQLAPGAHKQIAFTVHVPAGTPAGEWVGGIVAEMSHRLTRSKSKQKANVQIKIRDLTIVAVESNVPGPRVTAFSIGRVKTGGRRGFQQLFVHFTSNGNVLVKPTGRVSVYDSKNKLVETLTFKMDTFLPQTAIDYPLLLKQALAAGDYRAVVTLRVPGGKIVTTTQSFSVSEANVKQVFTSASPTQAPPVSSSGSSSSSTPWALIGGAVGLLLLLALVFWLLVRRRKGGDGPPPATFDPAPPTLTTVAPAERPEPPASPVPVVPPKPAVSDPQPENAATRPETCNPHHLWDVAYDRAQLGGDGVWRFPHRCQTCGLELLATDVADASAQATAA